mmetsp:Transcript_26581/g.40577  ORF Transcript_26581/g.40577 Transcript_26581/m.40577 type:complete len:87 (-) Transcript_26581:262-522(-)
MQDLERKVEQSLLRPTKKKSKTHADGTSKLEKGRSSPTKEEPYEKRKYASELLADTPKDQSPAKTHKDLNSNGTPNKDLMRRKSRK